jgi:hypothetical protein
MCLYWFSGKDERLDDIIEKGFHNCGGLFRVCWGWEIDTLL